MRSAGVSPGTSSTFSAAMSCRRAPGWSGCSSGSAPVADEIGAAPYLALPEKNAAERQIARFEEGASLEEIYAEQVVGVPVRG